MPHKPQLRSKSWWTDCRIIHPSATGTAITGRRCVIARRRNNGLSRRANRALLDALRAAQYDGDEAAICTALDKVAAPDALFRLAHPFGDMTGPQGFYDGTLATLKAAWRDVERRDWLATHFRQQAD